MTLKDPFDGKEIIRFEEARLEKMEELGHPEWLGELVNYATVPHSADERIQSVAKFKVRLENQGEMP